MTKKVIEFSKEELQNFLDDPNSCVKIIKSVYSLVLYPYHLNDYNAAIKEILNSRIAKYERKLGGILLGYKNVKLLSNEGTIVADSCYVHLDINAEFYIFKPEVGSSLKGIVNKQSESHVGCLVHRVFNVSVPRSQEDEEWPGYFVELGQEVVVNVTYINLDARLPYIRAVFQMDQFTIETSSKKKKRKKNKENQELNQEEDVVESTPVHKTKKHKVNMRKLINVIEEDDQLDSPKEKKKKRKSKECVEDTVDISLKEEPTVIKEKKKKLKSRECVEDIVHKSLKEECTDIKENKKQRKSKEFVGDSIDMSLTEESAIIKEKKKKRKPKECIEDDSVDMSLKEESTVIKEKKKKRILKEENINEIELFLEKDLNPVKEKNKGKSKEKEKNIQNKAALNCNSDKYLLDDSNNLIEQEDTTELKIKRRSKTIHESFNKDHDELSKKKKRKSSGEEQYSIIDQFSTPKGIKNYEQESETRKKHKNISFTTRPMMVDYEDQKHKKKQSKKNNSNLKNIDLILQHSDLHNLFDESGKERNEEKLDEASALDTSKKEKKKISKKQTKSDEQKSETNSHKKHKKIQDDIDKHTYELEINHTKTKKDICYKENKLRRKSDTNIADLYNAEEKIEKKRKRKSSEINDSHTEQPKHKKRKYVDESVVADFNMEKHKTKKKRQSD